MPILSYEIEVSFTCKLNSFSYEWLNTKTRSEKGAKGNSEMAYRPFATNDHMVENQPYWRASSLLFPHWDVKTKRPQPVKLDLSLFSCPSAGIIMSLPSSMADFVPCDRLLQKAYCYRIV